MTLDSTGTAPLFNLNLVIKRKPYQAEVKEHEGGRARGRAELPRQIDESHVW